MALKIEMLRCFAAVARSGSLGSAAQLLGRTPSALSMMLKQLETHLGEPLFETDRKNKLTVLGQFVLEQAERELQQFDNTVKAIEGFARATHGRVRIAAVPSVAGTLMPRVIAQNISSLQHVEIELRDMDSSSVLHELSRGRIDIGIATKGPANAGLHNRPLLSDAFGVICARSHPLAQGRGPIAWEDLRGARLIANSLSAGIPAPQSQELHDGAMLTAQNLTSLIAMVRADIGVTILPEMAVQADGSADLLFRPLPDPGVRRQIHLLRQADSPLSPAARAMEARIVDCAAAIPFGSLD